jgi:hypothetical protein
MADGPRQFVILKHDHPYLHWDFLLEQDGVLESWRLLREPMMTEWLAAEPIPDHRLVYLDYEGPVSKGRGSVTRVISGRYSIDSDHNPGGVFRTESHGLVLVRTLTLTVHAAETVEPTTVAARLATTFDQRWFWQLSHKISDT